MANFITPAASSGDYLANLKAARGSTGAGSGSGDLYLKVDDRSGRMTFGPEMTLLEQGHKFAAGLHGFRHGYIDMQGGQLVDRKVVPMGSGPRPRPPGGKYGTYSGGGPRDVTEVELSSIDEPGFKLVFTAWGVSSANRVGNLLEQAIVHAEATPEGKAGFQHPVIVCRSGMYHLKARKEPDGTDIPARDIWHWDYTVVDWLHLDGETLLSKSGGAIPAPKEAAADGGTPPWEEDDLTDEERELLET